MIIINNPRQIEGEKDAKIKYNILKLCIRRRKKIIWRFCIRSLFAINEVMIRLSELTKMQMVMKLYKGEENLSYIIIIIIKLTYR